MVQVDEFDYIDLSEAASVEWIKNIRCDIRVHYSSPSETKFDVLKLINHVSSLNKPLFFGKSLIVSSDYKCFNYNLVQISISAKLILNMTKYVLIAKSNIV